ncbi:hypothetical protein GUJ93_ZPchr0007g3659 [Zizania palustris]|uniref:Pectin acetylesterase n=1 Tax=Zizania palustris TaxID=103762 RepID=A0A8J5W5U6_ZIZPA|nr:hypothetical protein GUJ93_ZPchr0007g3659 [Zizania palustris]
MQELDLLHAQHLPYIPRPDLFLALSGGKTLSPHPRQLRRHRLRPPPAKGGAWCNTIENCSERKKKTYLGSSTLMGAVEFDGILSSDKQLNSDFYNWNKVVVRYCDGASFAGDTEAQDVDGSTIYFRGLRIWNAVLDELMGKGLARAKQVIHIAGVKLYSLGTYGLDKNNSGTVMWPLQTWLFRYVFQAILSGCSAGGLATLLHCNDFHALFPKEVSSKCLPDGGFFLDAEGLAGERYATIFSEVVQLQNVCEVLAKDCLAKKNRTECFFAAEIVKSIKAPTLIVNSAYDSWQIQNILAPADSYNGQSWSGCKSDIRNCSSSQIQVLNGFRKQFVDDVKVVQDKKGWGLFIDSCFYHCQLTEFPWSPWNSSSSPELGNKTVAKAIGDWYFERSQQVKQIDCEYPCNPSCS